MAGEGWNLSVVIASFLGAMVSLSYRPPQAFGSALSQVAIGTVSGNYGAPAAADFYPLPPTSQWLLAFLIGLTAMHWLIPALFGLLGIAIVRARRYIGEYLGH